MHLNQQLAQRELRIFTLNVNSLITHHRRHDLQEFISRHNPDVIMLNETRLNKNHRIEYRGYELIRDDRLSGQGGGTGILIRNNISFHRINTRGLELRTFEATAIKVRTTGTPIILIAVYSPRLRGGLDTNELRSIFDWKDNLEDSWIILGGDLNAKHQDWLNLANCERGNQLQKWIGNNPDVRLLHSAEPTFHRGDTLSYLDLFLTSTDVDVKLLPGLRGMLKTADYPSDHCAVELTVTLGGRLKKQQPTMVKDYHHANWTALNARVNEGIQNINVDSSRNLSAREIDDAVAEITALINRAADENIPLLEIRRDAQLPLPDNIVQLVKHKNRLRSRWQRRRYDFNAWQLKSEINCLSQIIGELIRNHYIQHWTKTLRKVKTGRDVFKRINQLSGRCRRSGISDLQSDINPGLASDDKEKAGILGRHFEAAHKQHINGGDPELLRSVAAHTNTLRQNIGQPLTSYSPDAPADPSERFAPERHLVSVSQVRGIIKSRANKRSQGVDNIPNVVLRKLNGEFEVFLAVLINQAYNIGYFPASWKEAVVIPIQKKGKPPEQASSYRPISLLPCISKIFEVALRQRIEEHCEEHNILPDDQYGFRPRRCTSHPLAGLEHDITTALNRGVTTIAVTLDMEKAFDTTWQEGLVYKMEHIFQFSEHMCRMVLSYLTDRHFTVKAGGALSAKHSVAAGVPQGGALSATLFALYVADLPYPIHSRPPIQRLQYADDLIIYLSSRNLPRGESLLNRYLETLTEYHCRWRLKANPAKCEAIVFKGPARNHNRQANKLHRCIDIKIRNQSIPLSPAVKYLGVTFGNNGLHNRHVDALLVKAGGALHAIGPIMRTRDGLNTKVRLLCYKQLIRPILAYGFCAWSSISSAQMEKIRVFERKCLRTCIGYRRPIGDYKYMSNKQLYEKANVERIDRYLVKLTLSFLERPTTLEFLPHIQINEEHLNEEFKPPWTLQLLHEMNRLHQDGKLIYYNRRHQRGADQTNFEELPLVCSTSQ